ncbi:penicillin-binding protein [Streptomyces sp. WAC 00631]|uniref:transglycosylase domain-containing protein n=1 Tax=Streptomyces sp. WAC 00631 TaxID=2203201 RepID=UPI000F788977|nr:transglycosylase domain-containing protein [Streptomyces sp. WAC 00631]MCC5032347.1 penicillin-binding protein [Streptomyces sp. WAC 00631]
MSEHRRKPPQSAGGGRAAARRGAQASGRRAAPRRGATEPESPPPGEGRPYGGRAEARRAAQRGGGGRRRAAEAGATATGAGAVGRGRRAAANGPQKKRLIDYPRSGRTGARRWIPSWKQVAGTAVGFMGLLVGGAGIAFAVVDIPQVKDDSQVEKNVYYWADGEQMVVAGAGEFNRQIVKYDSIPPAMRNAVIAAENASFEDDPGVDPMGIARAVFNMAKGGTTQSGSTITQQYVKNAMLSQEQTISRKVRELFISIKVGAVKDKEEILAGYLNTAYYGRGAYGIQAASRAYYGKDCDDLTASESAFLSATLNGPNLYDPAGGVGSAATPEKNRKRAEERWAWTLKREVETGRMKAAERSKWIADGFPTPNDPKPATNKAGQIGYLTTLADNFITSKSSISKAQLDRGGYEIHTTFDKKKMLQLEKAVQKVTKENLKPKERDEDKYVQFGGASIDPRSGEIVAIYGGKDATEHFTNNSDYTGVPVGSTFKPFVLAAAMSDGVRDPEGDPDQGPDQRTPVSPLSVYNGDNKVKLLNYDGSTWLDKENKEWHQTNDGDKSYGQVTLRKAMQHSVNTPFIQLGVDVGTDKVKETALEAGLVEDQLAATVPSFSLGTSSPSAIRLAGSYATFAAEGEQITPWSVKTVEKNGQPVYEHKAKKTQGLDTKVANNVTDVLKNVVEKGTGTSAQLPDGRPAAGKTGTTDGNKSAWFAGYTPQLSTAIGMFRVNDRAEKQKFLEMYGTGGQQSIHGSSFPAQIWADYMGRALKGEKIEQFPKPEPIGKKVYGDGASPTPTPTPTPTPSESESTEPSPSETPSETPSSSPSKTCGFFDPKCKDEDEPTGGADGGTDGGVDGGADGGADGGISSSPTTTPPGGGNGNNGGGGWLGGPDGDTG